MCNLRVSPAHETTVDGLSFRRGPRHPDIRSDEGESHRDPGSSTAFDSLSAWLREAGGTVSESLSDITQAVEVIDMADPVFLAAYISVLRSRADALVERALRGLPGESARVEGRLEPVDRCCEFCQAVCSEA
jgi:hypothetical protein